jgi:hypothetical protein
MRFSRFHSVKNAYTQLIWSSVSDRNRLVNYKKGALDSQQQVIKVYQLLAHGRWFSPGTPASSTTNILSISLLSKTSDIVLIKKKTQIHFVSKHKITAQMKTIYMCSQ